MKNLVHVRILNSIAWGLLIGLCVYGGFINPVKGSFSSGQLQGAIYGLVILAILLFIGTVYYTRRSGGSWKKVGSNLSRNFLATISYAPFSLSKKRK